MASYLRFVWVTVVLLTTTVVLLPFHLVSVIFKLRTARYAPYIWHNIACWLIGLNVQIKGQLSRNRPLMIASNHSSWLDILVLGSSLPVTFIAKSEVANWAIFGHLAKLQQTVFVDRTRRQHTGEKVSEIAARMNDGEVVVLFPEGTTSDGNYVLPFKSALFGAVQRAQNNLADHTLMVQPVSIAYLSAHGLPLGRGGRDLTAWPGGVELLPHLRDVILEGSIGAEITFAEPVEFREDMSRSDIAKQCGARVRAALHQSLHG